MAKRNARRPRGSPETEKKDVPFNLRIAKSEKEAFERAAELAGVSVSTWVRVQLRAAAMRELDTVGELAPFLSKRVQNND